MLTLALAAATLSPAARAQVDAVAAAASRYADIEVAKAEGWKPFGGDEPLMGQHWSHRDGPDYVGSDARLDWRRPSNLIYASINGRMVLTGVSFNVRLEPGEPVLAGFVGTADRWHVHDFGRAVAAATETRPMIRWLANGWLDEHWRGTGGARVAMVHVWTGVPNPDGPFADHNRVVPYLKLGLPAAWANGASLTAARGLNLATETGCEDYLGGRIWIADTGRAKAKALREACAAAAAHVREGLASRDPARANAMGERGWAMLRAAEDRILTPEHKARIAAMAEHGEHAGESGGHEHH